MLTGLPDASRDPAPHSAALLPPRPSEVRPRRPGLPRRLLLGGLLFVLVAGTIAARQWSAGPAAAPVPERAASTTTTITVRPPVTFAASVGDTTGCQSLAGSEPQLLCPIPDGVVEYTQVDDAQASYRLVAGADDGVGARGEAACAHGRADERAWARTGAPTVVAGRYLCRVTDDRAEIWWTVYDGHLVGHAFRRDDDLAALFAWWRDHP